MKNRKLLYLAILILPFLSLPLLGRKEFKKYLPAAIFICTFTKAIDQLGERKKWWVFYRGIPPLNSMNFLNFGAYFVSSLWMLKMTYGRFPLYLIANFIYQLCFIFLGGVKLVSQLKIFTLIKLSKLQYLGVDTLRALLLYGFQFITDLTSKDRQKSDKQSEQGY